MRMPSEAELSKEQRTIINAPDEGTLLVVGPPGSGKTVIALWRAGNLARRDPPVPVKLTMHNQVLWRYTENPEINKPSIKKETFSTLLGKWWRDSVGTSFPVIDGDSKKKDYEAAFQEIIANEDIPVRIRQSDSGHWGNLILDEAQDFKDSAHRLLFYVQKVIFADWAEPPTLLILMDENQKLDDDNVSNAKVRDIHILCEDDEYELRKNYRNTLQIARFSRHYYIDGIGRPPDFPDREGVKPRVYVTDSIDEDVEMIAKHAENHQDREIGVLVPYTSTRKRLFEKLQARLSGSCRVQTYGYETGGRAGVKKVKFEPGTVTILCFASAKGLEFDTVILPQLQTYRLGAIKDIEAKMALYVMCSRARTDLFLTIQDQDGAAPIWGLLPEDALYDRYDGYEEEDEEEDDEFEMPPF